MIKITIAYPRIADRAFDHDYFLNRHLPRLFDLVGDAVKRATVERGVDAAPWPAADYEMICSLECETREAFETAFFPYVEDLQDDMEYCGGAPPTIQVSEIVLERAWRSAASSPERGEVHRLRRPSTERIVIAAAG
jgi:uncharacterized protein (TIGR02118 family)